MHEPIVVCISDTHELHREVNVPDGNILIHAGDFTMFSKSATEGIEVMGLKIWGSPITPLYGGALGVVRR